MDTASIEEMNRMRAALGMKPLPVSGAQREATPEDEDPSATYEGRLRQGEANFRKLQDAEAAARKREAKAAAIKKARDDAKRHAVLDGPTLGDDDGKGDVDAKAWLKGQKKRQKKIQQARKIAEEQEAAETAAAAAKQYTSTDLTGVQIGHDVSLLDGDEQVLTLKDATLLDNEEEGDELEILELRDRERVAERASNLKRKIPSSWEVDDESEERGILAQYDEEINGKKKKNFTLDSHGAPPADLTDIFDGTVNGKKAALQALSLDILNDVPVSDYQDIADVKVKHKKKKKRTKVTREKRDEDALFPADVDVTDAGRSDLMDVDSGTFALKKKTKSADDFVDDDELQATLALQRANKLKKSKRMKPAELAKQLKEDDAFEDLAKEADGNAGGLIVDSTTEFLKGLQTAEPEERERKLKGSGAEESVTVMQEDSEEDEDVPMTNATAVEETADGEEQSWAEEKLIGQGMGATLSLLKERGIIEVKADEDLNTRFRASEQFRREKHLLLAQVAEETRRQREQDRQSGRLDRMSTKEREDYSARQNQQREYRASQKLQDLFNQNYTPNFDVTYTDEHGRKLNRKEAWKSLSHQFHGKQSGNQKTSKLLKKIEQEKKDNARSILDVSENVGMSSATAQQLKKRKEAGVRLA